MSYYCNTTTRGKGGFQMKIKAYFWLNLCVIQDSDSPAHIFPRNWKTYRSQISDQRIPGSAKFATSLKITIKEASIFLPSKCRFPIKPEAQQGLKP